MRSWMIGLLLGILPVPLLPALPGWPVTLVLAIGGALALLHPGNCARWCSGLAMGAALALLHGQVLLQARLKDDCVGPALTASGWISSLPRVSPIGGNTTRQRFEFTLQALSPARCRGPRRVLLSYYGPHRLVPGERWRFELRLKKPWGLANPGSFNMQAWFAESGMDAVGSVRVGGAHRLAAATGRWSWHHRQRQAISGRIGRLAASPAVTAVLRAVTVADRSGIDAGLWSLFQQFGVNHLLVISGLHVGLLAGAGYLLGGVLQRGMLLCGIDCPWLSPLLALLLAGCYAALAGFSLSTQRALCMLASFILAGLAGRSSGPVNNLLLAAVVVLVLNPLAVLGSGLWLSFGAVAALLWLARWQRGLPRWRQLLWSHGFMSLVMLPMGAWWFGGSSLVAGLANLLMVPLVGLLVVPVALLAVLGDYCAPWMAPTLWRLAAWPLEQVLPAARHLADTLDGGLFWQLVPGLAEVLLAALGVSLLILPATAPLRLLSALLVLPLLLPPDPTTRREVGGAPGALLVTVLDVGQGTAVLVRAGPRALLYDTGGGDPAGFNMARAVILPYLRRLGIVELDTLVISHPDSDHSAGAGTLLRAMPVRRLYTGGSGELPARGKTCRPGEAWHWPAGQRFRVLSGGDSASETSNNNSCVLQVEAAGYRLLLAGDIETARERQLVRRWGDQLRSDWLLAAHHGSATSSSWAWLKTVRASHLVISSGYANPFGHPHPGVLRRFREAAAGRGVAVYNTAADGALEFAFRPGEPVAVSPYRRQVRRFWM